MYFEVLKEEETLVLLFLMLNDREKGRSNAFSCYKLTSKLCPMYLDVKLQDKKVHMLHLVKKKNLRKL